MEETSIIGSMKPSVGLCEGMLDNNYINTDHLRLGKVHFHITEIEGVLATGKYGLLVYTGSTFSLLEPVNKNVLEYISKLWEESDKLLEITDFNYLVTFLVQSLKSTRCDIEAVSPVVPGMKDEWIASVLAEIAESLDEGYGFVSAPVLAKKAGVSPKQAREYLRQYGFTEIKISKRNVVFSKSSLLFDIAKGCF